MSTAMPQGGNMIAQSLLPEFDHEMSNTRRVLERVPDDKFGWKPHEKSATFGWLATHVATMTQWGQMTLQTPSFDVNPPGGQAYRLPEPQTNAALLALFDQHRDAFRAALASASDADLLESWALLAAGKEVFRMPRVAVLRGMIFNHIIHHRGQLTVDLRLNGIPVPALFGPSADEPV